MKILTKKDLPIGTKVVPHDKTGGVPFEKYSNWNEGKDVLFLYVVGYSNLPNSVILHYIKNETHGSIYNYSDITLYQEQLKVKKSEILEMIQNQQKQIDELKEAVFSKANDIVIDQPKYEIGATYAFADNEDDFDEGFFAVGKLEIVDFKLDHPFKREENGRWKFARRIEYNLK